MIAAINHVAERQGKAPDGIDCTMSKPVYAIIGVFTLYAMVSPSPRPAAPERPRAAVPEPLGTEEPAAPSGNGYNTVTLSRAPDGHFYTEARVNNTTVRFLVDTGASTIALSKRDAQAAGLHFSSSEFTVQGQGAGGVIALKPVTLDRVAIGAFEVRDVGAAIVDGDLHVSLLGQNWLSRVGTVTISGDKMVLR